MAQWVGKMNWMLEVLNSNLPTSSGNSDSKKSSAQHHKVSILARN